MADSLRRVSIIEERHGTDTASVDLALPAMQSPQMLMPAIVDLVCGDSGGHAYRYRLSYLGGQLLDDSRSLTDNDVRDGDVLVLSAAPGRTHTPVSDDVCRALASAGEDPGEPDWQARTAAGLWACAVVVVALAWAATTALGHGLPVAVAAVLAVGVGAAGVAVSRSGDVRVSDSLQAMCAALAGLVAFLVVPGPAAPAGLFLGSVAVVSIATVQIRLTRRGTTTMIGCAAGGTVTAVSFGVAAASGFPSNVIGATMTTLSLAALGAAPRISIALAGLTPPPVDTKDVDTNDVDAATDVDSAAVHHSHQILTGTIIGLSASAALGAAIVAVSSLHGEPPRPAAAFTATVGAALVLLARSRVGTRRRRVLAGSGIICLTAAFVILVRFAPWSAPWAAAAVLGPAALALFPLGGAMSPVLRRAVDAAEYLSLAAVPPLACWVADVYGLVRGLSL